MSIIFFDIDGTIMDVNGSIPPSAAEAVRQLRQAGVESAVLNLGGNVQTLGTRPGGGDWQIAIRDPADEGALLGTLWIPGSAAVVTSGGYQRCFLQDGQIYWHILDPNTAAPARSGLASVTVVSDSGLLCDGLSTALFVMGEERALEFWRTGGYDFDLVLVTADGRVVVTAGLADRFEEVKDSGYTYETVS